VGIRVGVAYSRNILALRTGLRNLNLKSQFPIFFSFRDIRVHTNDFLKCVGVKVGEAPCWKKLALRRNLRNLHVALIVSEISAFIRTDGQTDRRTWLDRPASYPYQKYIYCVVSERFLLPVTYFPTNVVYPFTLRVSGINMFLLKSFQLGMTLLDIFCKQKSQWGSKA